MVMVLVRKKQEDLCMKEVLARKVMGHMHNTFQLEVQDLLVDHNKVN